MSVSRRAFLTGMGAALFSGRNRVRAAAFPVRFRQPNPYTALHLQIEPGADEFAQEVQATRITVILNRLHQTGSLPLAPGFEGKSPLPGHDFEPGLREWLRSLGDVRRCRYSLLANGVVRYEIASTREGALEYRTGLWKTSWSGELLSRFTPLEEHVAQSGYRLFHDVTIELFDGCASFAQQLSRGIPYWRSRLDSATGIDIYGMNGVSVADIDNDGIDEIFVCQPGGLPNRLYKLVSQKLRDITDDAGLGLLDDTTCALFLDLRNIGRQDLVLMRSAGPLLFLNDGTGKYTEQPDAFRFGSRPAGTFTGMAAADYDRDGRLDLYCCTYSFFQSEDQYRYAVPYHDARNGPPNFLFRNRLNPDGTGFFEDVTERVGLNENNNRFSFAPAWCDYDNDGWPDLCVASDFGRKNLYKNNAGTFRDVAAEAGVNDAGPGMSAAWFDYDGDGKPDLYVSNMWTDVGQRVAQYATFHSNADARTKQDYLTHARGNTLYRNRGDGRFEQTAEVAGVEMGRWAWGSDGIDFDNDGTPEIFVCCGMLTNARPEDLEGFFWRQVVAKSPLTSTASSAYENGWNAINQFVREEYSWSGRQENIFYVRNGGRYADFSGVSGLDNAEDSRAFAVLDLDGDGRMDLVLKNRLGPQVRVFLNNSAGTRNSLAFVLQGTKSNRDAIGARVRVDGQVKFLNAGSGYLSQHTKRLHFGLGNRDRAASVRVDWPSGGSQEFHDLATGFVYSIEEGSAQIGKTPFRPREGAAQAARPVGADNKSGFADTWLLDPIPLPDTRRGPGLFGIFDGPSPLPAGIPAEALDANSAPQDVVAAYALFRRYLFDTRSSFTLPLILLLDRRGMARKIYAAAPDRKTVERDLGLLDDPDVWKFALPFPGRYHHRPRRNHFRLGAAFLGSGYPEEALRYLQEEVSQSPANSVALMAIAQIHLEAGRLDPARQFADDALRVNSKLAGAWNTLGGVHAGKDQTEPALECFERAMALQPDMKAAILNAAQAQARLNHADQAETLFRRAIALDPLDSETADQFGLLLATNGRNTEAREWLQKAIELKKDNASAINNLGVLYMQMGQTGDAIAALNYGLRVSPNTEKLYLNLAKVYLKTGDRARARDVLHRLLVIKPGDAVAERALSELDKLE